MPVIFNHPSPLNSPGFIFWQKFIKWQRQIDIVLAPLDLTQASFSILAITGWLSQNNSHISTQYVRQKVVVDMSGMQKMQVSLILQGLKKKKLILMTPYLMDLREQQIELTPEGIDTLAKAIVLVEQVDQKFLVESDYK